jgi:hypothetical protein
MFKAKKSVEPLTPVVQREGEEKAAPTPTIDETEVDDFEYPEIQDDEADPSYHEEEEDDNDDDDKSVDEGDGVGSPLSTRTTVERVKRLQSSVVIPNLRPSPRQSVETPLTKRLRSSSGIEASSAPSYAPSQESLQSSESTQSNSNKRLRWKGVPINAADIQLLYGTKPWETLYARRIGTSRTFKYEMFPKEAQEQVMKMLRFQRSSCKTLCEWQHWIRIAPERRSPRRISSSLIEAIERRMRSPGCRSCAPKRRSS